SGGSKYSLANHDHRHSDHQHYGLPSRLTDTHEHLMKTYKSILLACAIGITSYNTAHAQETAAPADSQVQRLLAELMMNVDLSLMMRIQQTLSNNMALIGSHSKTYYGCLRTEGVLEEGQTPGLE